MFASACVRLVSKVDINRENNDFTVLAEFGGSHFCPFLSLSLSLSISLTHCLSLIDWHFLPSSSLFLSLSHLSFNWLLTTVSTATTTGISCYPFYSFFAVHHQMQSFSSFSSSSTIIDKRSQSSSPAATISITIAVNFHWKSIVRRRISDRFDLI